MCDVVWVVVVCFVWLRVWLLVLVLFMYLRIFWLSYCVVLYGVLCVARAFNVCACCLRFIVMLFALGEFLLPCVCVVVYVSGVC